MEVSDELSDWDVECADETELREQHVRNLHSITNIFIYLLPFALSQQQKIGLK